MTEVPMLFLDMEDISNDIFPLEHCIEPVKYTSPAPSSACGGGRSGCSLVFANEWTMIGKDYCKNMNHASINNKFTCTGVYGVVSKFSS